ncbi:MAG: YncE family protein [Polaromonas sp.]
MNVFFNFLASGLCALTGLLCQPEPAQAPPAGSVTNATASATVTTPVFVLNSLEDSVSVINPLNWTEIKRIDTGKQPHHLYLTPDEKSVIVANALSDSLTFIDPKTAEVQRTVRGVLDPYHLRFSPDMKWFVTAANRLNHIDIYRWDGKEMVLAKRIPTSKTPSHLWIDSKSSTIYSTMQESDELIAVDLASQTIKWRIKTGATPADVIGTANDKLVLVALTGGDGVEVYDVSGKAPLRSKFIKTAAGAHAFRAFGDKRHLLVSNRVANTISKIDLQTLEVVETFAAPGGPDCMDVSRDGSQILVTSRWIRKLTLIDVASHKVVRQVNVGRSPHGVWTLDHAPR